ncbi:unnamed protein product [Phytophthora lilii]|uniref:Unnamed protein product n=1 Tax=Phytophthora lilii TaxID=2077276 RepID=A0A9W6U2H6_9STRA|nr:unnamed protein product [Phytophthora lilii]
MALFDFNVILGVDNFLSSLACVTELCAVVRLRFTMPTLVRPYKVNISDHGLLTAMAIPFSIGSFVMLNELTKSTLSLVLNIIALASGIICQQFLRKPPASAYTPLAAAIRLELGTPSPGGTFGLVTPASPTVLEQETQRKGV